MKREELQSAMERVLERCLAAAERDHAKGARLFFPNGIELIKVAAKAAASSANFDFELTIAGPQAPKERSRDSSPVDDDDLELGQKVPNKSEISAVGDPKTRIKRGTAEFKALTKNANSDIDFKDEEGTAADQMMTAELAAKVDALAALVKSEWPDLKLRVTEAWDENIEHGGKSTHYEARAVDIATSDKDSGKLGRLGRLAVQAEFGWVFYEDELHVHASVAK